MSNKKNGLENDETINENDDFLRFGEKLTALRQARDLTQQDIEDRSRTLQDEYGTDFVSRGYISQLEQGNFLNMTVKRFIAILTVLDATPEELGIRMNLKKGKRSPGMNIIYVPNDVPADVVESIRRILQLTAYGARTERQARDTIAETIASQALEARGEEKEYKPRVKSNGNR